MFQIAETIVWLGLLLVSICGVFVTVGMRSMVAFFPEGWRWWQTPLQLIMLAVFAAVVLNHPF